MVFSISQSCATKHHYLIPGHCHHPKKKACTHEWSLLTPFFSQSLANANLLSVPVDLPSPSTSYKWNCKVCGLWCLASLTWHNYSQGSPMVQHVISTSFLFMGESYPQYGYLTLSKNPFQSWCTLVLFPFLDYCTEFYNEHSHTGFCVNRCLEFSWL